MFGRFKRTTRVSTGYAAEDGRLRVAERDVDEADSREDAAKPSTPSAGSWSSAALG